MEFLLVALKLYVLSIHWKRSFTSLDIFKCVCLSSILYPYRYNILLPIHGNFTMQWKQLYLYKLGSINWARYRLAPFNTWEIPGSWIATKFEQTIVCRCSSVYKPYSTLLWFPKRWVIIMILTGLCFGRYKDILPLLKPYWPCLWLWSIWSQ